MSQLNELQGRIAEVKNKSDEVKSLIEGARSEAENLAGQLEGIGAANAQPVRSASEVAAQMHAVMGQVDTMADEADALIASAAN
ncbi:hypothetical protein [Salininema proteolyticum]|uniref:Methyl-accepting chemotaxis protein n=1 Tax=Salininema proteolyticum TaxID=1607685 RepID=A0ABV8U3P3_9ACTN